MRARGGRRDACARGRAARPGTGRGPICVNAGLSIFMGSQSIGESSHVLHRRRPPAAASRSAAPPPTRATSTLTASDGNKFAAYFARAEKPTGAGMVVLPDVRGLHQFYKELAQRFAEAGVDSVAIDYFGRTAGIGDRSDSLRVHASRPADDARGHRRRHRRRDRVPEVEGWRRGQVGVHGRFLLRRFELVEPVGARSPGSTAASASTAGRQRSEPFIPKMKAPLLILVAGADAGDHAGAGHGVRASSSTEAERAASSSTSTRERRTASSTAPTSSGRTPATTPGGGCWTSSRKQLRPDVLSRRSGSV